MPRIEAGSGPKYLAIAEALSADIRSGRLAPGYRLPPQRLLAKELGVDLTTVTRAFNEARRMGLIEANTGRGSFVSGKMRRPEIIASSEAPIVDLSMNMPPQPEEAKLQERIQDGIASVLSSPQGLLHLHYQESVGARPDRIAAAQWLLPRLGETAIDRIVVTGGAQTALYAIVRILAQPGEAICVPGLTYPGLRAIAEQLKVRLVPVAMDEEGLVPAALEELCQREALRAVYCVPTIHNPTTFTMSHKRREMVAEVALRNGIAIVEDDAYGVLPAQAPMPIAALAPEITWHIATLSKCVTPALRTAYVVTPGLSDTLRLAAEIRAMALMMPPLMSALASKWIIDGTLDAITTAIRRESAVRQSIARRILQGLEFQANPEGHHIWLTLPERWRRADLNIHARQSGLALVPSEAFAVGPAPDAIRLSLGAAQSHAVLERGLKVLATVLSHGPSTLSSIV
ncbi:PLP-dependent aminotransferase family protein [Microvirga guangxiensis]|uniref:8-amino-7-oxononanoate synthase n=1 Tax=Microvirga guangxiensis TaxID=549386 RepID=A0A1G5ITV7_9HYPH|nr:PLP-dependent aminotransferase family protein [Microvirga guangxiensis]SCY79512.1 transcriptional regulator, GntR family [Microvirga guangxiensis]